MNEGRDPGPAIDVSGLSVSFGKIRALDGIDLKVRRGEIFGIVGTNGAGKSTLVDVLSGMVKPSTGRVMVLGLNPIKETSELRKAIGVVAQETSVEEKLTALENMVYFGRLLDMPSQAARLRAEELTAFFGLADRKDDPVETYSAGMKRKVHLACSIMHMPGLIIIDEAMAGFDPVTKREVERMLLEMNSSRGITCLLTTHDLAEARAICDRLAVFHRGKVVAQGSWKEISSTSDATLLIKGVPRQDRSRVAGIIAPRTVSDDIGGFRIAVCSQAEAFEVAGLLEKGGIRPSSISFEVPTDDVFEALIGGSGGGVPAP